MQSSLSESCSDSLMYWYTMAWPQKDLLSPQVIYTWFYFSCTMFSYYFLSFLIGFILFLAKALIEIWLLKFSSPSTYLKYFNASIQTLQIISWSKILLPLKNRFATKIFNPFYANISINFVIEIFMHRLCNGFFKPFYTKVTTKSVIKIFILSIHRSYSEIRNPFIQISKTIREWNFYSLQYTYFELNS